MYALYARQSVDNPDSISIESQLESCRREAENHSYQIYTDKGFSGKNFNRPAFARMLQDIRAGQIQAVVVYKLDRVSRSVLDFGKMMEEFERYHVTFISATEKFDTQTPMGKAMLNIAMVFAQLERETIQKRVADSYLSRSRHGLYMGGRVPYGYQLEPAVIDGVRTSSYIENPDEAEHIRQIFLMYAQSSASLGDIVRYLNEHKIKHLRGSIWNTARLSELLRNPVYVQADLNIYDFYRSQGVEIVNEACDFQGVYGCYLYKGKKRQETLQPTNDMLVLAPHEGLITSDLWLACRQKCMEHGQARSGLKSKNTWLAGKVKCGKCGYAMAVKKSNTKMKRYFICSAKYTAKQCPGAGTVYVTVVEECLEVLIRKKIEEIEVYRFKNPNINPKLQTYRLEISQITASIDNLLNQMEGSTDAAAGYIKQRINQLDEKRQKIEEQINTINGSISKLDKQQIVDLADNWHLFTRDKKQKIADILIKVIKIGENQIEIYWKI